MRGRAARPRGGARGAGGRLRPGTVRGGPARAAAAPSPPSSPGRRDAGGAAEGPGRREASEGAAEAGATGGAGGAGEVTLGWKDGLEQTWEVGPALGSGSFGEVKEASERWPVRAPAAMMMRTPPAGVGGRPPPRATDTAARQLSLLPGGGARPRAGSRAAVKSIPKAPSARAKVSSSRRSRRSTRQRARPARGTDGPRPASSSTSTGRTTSSGPSSSSKWSA